MDISITIPRWITVPFVAAVIGGFLFGLTGETHTWIDALAGAMLLSLSTLVGMWVKWLHNDAIKAQLLKEMEREEGQ